MSKNIPLVFEVFSKLFLCNILSRLKLISILLTFTLFTSSFVTSQKGIDFQCNFFTSSWIVIGTQYACSASATIKNGGENLTEVNGAHQVGRTNSDVRMLLVHDQVHLNSIPRNIETFFANLIGLEFFNGRILTISNEELRVFPNLQLFNMQTNLLTSLDGNIFTQNPRLQWIGLSENRLQRVGFGLLNGLNVLTTAFFLRNPCIDQQATTPPELSELITVLPVLCPPFDTTTTSTTTTTTVGPGSEVCSAGCLQVIEDLETEFATVVHVLTDKVEEQGRIIEDLVEKNHEQKIQIDQLAAEAASLNRVVGGYEERLVELEKQIREINANPRF